MWLPSHHTLISREEEVCVREDSKMEATKQTRQSKLAASRMQRALDKRHFNLASQQRRLRHLTCVCCRNMRLPLKHDLRGIQDMKLYFTLHADDNGDSVLYRSENINVSINPNWKEFDASMLTSNQSNTSTSCLICVWLQQRGQVKLMLRYPVMFSALRFVGSQLKAEDARYQPNTTLLKLQGGYYSTCPPMQSRGDDGDDETLVKMLMKVDQETVKWTYNISSVMRIHGMLKAIAETEVNVALTKSKIQECIKDRERLHQKQTLQDQLKSRVTVLQEEVIVQETTCKSESSFFNNRKQQLDQHENEVTSKQNYLEEKTIERKMLQSLHVQKRENLLKVSALLSFRRRQQVSELGFIYPVIELPGKASAEGHYAICNVRLPNSENFLGQDDEMLAVALGYTCHLVHMLAKILLLPLRYPLKPMGSRSTVLDFITDRLSDKEREFPLYTKGKEKFQFHYGVFLLNKDIAQIRYQCGLGTADLRNTLANIKQLAEARFGVKTNGETSDCIEKVPSLMLEPRNSIASVGIDRETPDDDEEAGFKSHCTRRIPKQTSLDEKSRSSRQEILCRQTSSPLASVEASSPDLVMGSGFDDIITAPHEGKGVTSAIVDSDISSGAIDAGVDCLDEAADFTSPDSVQNGVATGDIEPITRRDSYERQFSDILVIPDPFDQVHHGAVASMPSAGVD